MQKKESPDFRFPKVGISVVVVVSAVSVVSVVSVEV